MMNTQSYFEEVKSYKLLANKSLGQNFLVNPDVCSKIVEALDIKDDDKVLEIGAGLGSLSYFLAQKEAKTTLIDIDERMLSYLNNHFQQENIEIKRSNVLKEDLSSYTKIIGNLPYYITSSIIKHILLTAKNAKEVVLMTQAEVVDKFLKDKKVYPLTMLLKYLGTSEVVLNVSKNNFVPIPHVDSTVFKFIPNEHIKEDNKELLNLITRIFNLRRKTIQNILSGMYGKEKTVEVLNKMNVKPMLRPEQLDIEFYKTLLNLLK